MTAPNAVPNSVADGEDMRALRDQLRHGLSQLGIQVAVQLGTIGLDRSIVIPPLLPAEAQRLAEALRQATEPRSQEVP
jgi:hypothetical protein